MRLAKRLAFLGFDNSFGIIKGEQPLIRASRASKVAGTFLVLFWCAKENLAPMQKQSYPAPPAREAVYKSTTLPTSAGVAGTGPRRTASASRRTTNSTGCPAAKAGR